MVGKGDVSLRKSPVAGREGGGPGDDQLLGAYLARGDQGAFEMIVARHGARVLRVCRQVLGRSPEVDDVFQATFLLLATRAATIRDRAALGAWLHGVAHRMAVRSKARSARRAARERQAGPATSVPEPDDPDLPYIRRVLHAEVDRLPEQFRRPILLCYLEGRTNEEAARLLGCPSGTLKTRLARGREILRGRLARRGIALTAALLLLLLPGAAKAEAVPPWLIATTTEAAMRRARGTRRDGPSPAGVGGARALRTALIAAALVVTTSAWLLCRPSPARGTWLRWLVDAFHKLCH
jgi:RNA polymerase sigma factor (sigma-70 family)